MPRFSSSSSVKVYQIVFSLILLAVMWSAVRSMMFGAQFSVKMLVAAILGIAFVLVLDDKYWILSAFLFGFYETLPMVKFTGAELGSLILVSTCFVRRTIHRDVAVRARPILFYSALPFMIWMCIVWSQNPVGMYILGSSSMGGRFYFKVILAFLSLWCLSTMAFGEKDCKRLCWAMALGIVTFVFRGYLFGHGMNVVAEDSVHYRFIRLSFVAPLFLCRFSAPELLSSRWPLVGFLSCLGLCVYSGNRTAAMRPVLTGVLAPFFLRRDRTKTFGLFVCAAIVLAVVVAGHGTVWRLPFSIQRSLSFLPGKWDRKLDRAGFNDVFRSELRYWARQHIRRDPWFGDGGFSLDSEDMRWAMFNRTGFDANIAGHVISRNWHNVWLGMAADFGIPLSVAWALFVAVLLVEGFRHTRHLVSNSWRQTMYLYFYLLILIEFLNFFFNGGHTSLTSQQFFLWAGLMTAVKNGSVFEFPDFETVGRERETTVLTNFPESARAIR